MAAALPAPTTTVLTASKAQLARLSTRLEVVDASIQRAFEAYLTEIAEIQQGLSMVVKAQAGFITFSDAKAKQDLLERHNAAARYCTWLRDRAGRFQRHTTKRTSSDDEEKKPVSKLKRRKRKVELAK